MSQPNIGKTLFAKAKVVLDLSGDGEVSKGRAWMHGSELLRSYDQCSSCGLPTD